MTDQNKNVETLQTDVDQVAADLIETKKLTNETLKKSKVEAAAIKAEVAANKVKTAKEDATKKLEALSGKTDATSKLEIIKLETEIKKYETMLTALDLSKTDLAKLKIGVTIPETEKKDEKEKPSDKENKNRFKRQRDGFSDKTEENHMRKNTARVAWGIGVAVLAYKWLKALFGRGKNKKEKKESDDKDEEKKSPWKKILIWLGIWVGWILAWKNRDKIKDFFGNLFWKEDKDKTPEEKLSWSYDNLSESMKTKYRETWDDVDQYASSNEWFIINFSDDKKDDQDKKGAILFGLDKETKNLYDFSTNNTLDYIQDETTDDIVDHIINWWKEKMYNRLAPYLSKLESFKWFGASFLTDPATTLKEWLKSWTPAEREKELALFYKEYMNIINYVDEKKTLLTERLAKEEIIWKERINDETTVNEQDAIKNLLEDDVWKEGKLKSLFQSYTLADLSSIVKEYNINVSDVSQETEDLKEDLEYEADKLLQKDEDWSTALTRAEEDFEDGSLDEDSKKELVELCEDFLEDWFWENNKSFFGAYTHLITDIFAGNTELAESFLEKTQSKKAIEEFKAILTGYIQKLKVGNFSKEDLQSLKQQTETYIKTKNQYELSMKKMDKMSSWLHFDRMKVLTLPWDAMKDMGKIFGYWKTNSWRERIGYGLGGFYMTGQTLYIWSKLIPKGSLVGSIVKPIAGVAGKVGIKIGELPVTLTHEALKLITWKTHLTSWWWSKYLMIDATHLNKIEKEALLKNTFLRWEISESGVMRVVNKLEISSWGGSLQNFDAILKKRWLTDAKQIELFKKYRGNKDLIKLIIKEKPNTTLGIIKKVQYTFYDRLLKSQIDFDPIALSKLQKIDNQLLKMTTEWSNEKLFWEVFLKNTKTLDSIEDFMKNKKLMWLLTEVGNTSAEQTKLAQIFGKHFNTFKSQKELEWYLTFLKNQKKNITNTNEFVRNTIGKRNKLKTMDSVAQAKYIETQKVNISFLDKRINAMKDNFKKSAETLRKLIKNKKTPYPTQVESTAKGLEDIAKVSNEELSLLAESERMWNGAWLSAMSKDATLLKKLSPLFKNKEFLKELSSAKTSEAVKELFASKWIKNIPEEFATTLSKTTSTTKLMDTMKYVEKYESLSKIGKIFQNPAMKYAGRVLWRVLVVGTIALWWVLAYDKYQEWSKLKLTNKERGTLMEQDAFADIALTAAWACAFIPGIGWIAAWAILVVTGIVTVVKDNVIDKLNNYTKNYKDFINSTPLLIKQHILTTILGSSWEDRDFGDWMISTTPNSEKIIKYLAQKTWSEATKALLYTEEWKKNQLAMIDIDDTDLINKLALENPPITRAQIAEAKDVVEKNVQIKYKYLKKKCGTYMFEWKEYINVEKVVSVNKIKNEKWMKALDQLLLEAEYAIVNPEVFWNQQKVLQQEKEIKNILIKDKEKFILLDKLFTKDSSSLLYMYRYMNQYEQHLQQFGFDESGVCIEFQYDIITENMEYFDNYMKYKTIEQWIDIALYSSWFMEPNYVLTRNFFVWFALDKPLSDKEVYNSSNKLQTILYRIATEVIGVKINNSMEDIKNVFNENNEKMYGIYFDDNKLNVNGNYFSDTEYMWTDIATVKNIRADIQEQIKDSDLIDIWTGDTYLNKEIGNKYLKIIDQEIVR